MISEFDVIARYFQGRGPVRDDVVLGIGDDAALLQPPAGRQLVAAVDTLVAGRHFPENSAAADIGYKALAVNLSDLAAMGATPAWATLSLTVPAVNEPWLRGFAEGFFSLANEHQVALVGGDTTRGPLSVTVQLHGYVEPGQALRRAAAAPGHALFVSGTLGDAACALHQLQTTAGAEPTLLVRLNRPQPRVALGQALAGVASAAIDISDGLLADLGHILDASGCGATLWPERLPASAALQALPAEQRLDYQFNGGDDYELCFSVAPACTVKPGAGREGPAGGSARLQTLLQQQPVPVTEIGVIEAQTGLRCRYRDGHITQPRVRGFDHFRQDDHE